jgi:hypothetical protein
VTASERGLRALAGIISEDRSDLPEAGLPESLLADLMGQIRCDVISFEGLDSQRQETWFLQSIPNRGDAAAEDLDPVHWQHYWDCQPCSYPDRTGDLRRIVTIGDFYSARQWHSVGTYCEIYRPQGLEHDLMLTLPPPGPDMGRGRTVRLFFSAGPVQASPSVTGRCSRCWARTCTRPTWMPRTAAIRSPSSPPGRPTCCA